MAFLDAAGLPPDMYDHVKEIPSGAWVHCHGCGDFRKPKPNSVCLDQSNPGRPLWKGECGDCGTEVTKHVAPACVAKMSKYMCPCGEKPKRFGQDALIPLGGDDLEASHGRGVSASAAPGSFAAMMHGPKMAYADPNRFQRRLPEGAWHVQLGQTSVNDQKKSGRCWMYAGLNLVRIALCEKLKRTDIHLSQSFLFYYDKLERSLFFLREMDRLREEETTGKVVNFWLTSPLGGDGGHWNYFVNLALKYGVCPLEAMPETFNSSNSTDMNTMLERVLRKAAIEVRRKGLTGDEAYRKWKPLLVEILDSCLGRPPKRFALEWAVPAVAPKSDKDEKASRSSDRGSPARGRRRGRSGASFESDSVVRSDSDSESDSDSDESDAGSRRPVPDDDDTDESFGGSSDGGDEPNPFPVDPPRHLVGPKATSAAHTRSGAKSKKSNPHANKTIEQFKDDMKPLELLELSGVDLENFVVLTNDERHPVNHEIVIAGMNNMVSTDKNHHRTAMFNVPLEEMAQATKRAVLVHRTPVWLGCDVMKQSSVRQGIMDGKLFRFDKAFDGSRGAPRFPTLTREEALTFRDGAATHAMLIVGAYVNKSGDPVVFNVQNSWGSGPNIERNKGFLDMYMNYWKENVWEVVVPREAVGNYVVEGTVTAEVGDPLFLVRH